MRTCAMQLIVVLFFLHATNAVSSIAATAPELDQLVGQPADIAPSAYLYRADRKPEENSPESWLALMHYAGMPLNKPMDMNAPAIKRVLCAPALGRDPPDPPSGADLGRRCQESSCGR